jgi:serine phosphatase RsbU (regulator of sigma subunit)
VNRVSRVSLATVVIMVLFTLGGSWLTHRAVNNQENRLLGERTNEVGVVFSSAIDDLAAPMKELGAVLQATHDSPAAFARASAAAEQGSKGALTFALLEQVPTGFKVVLASGSALTVGQVITDARAQTLDRALSTKNLVPTSVIGQGSNRALGFALGGPAAPAGMVLYRQTALGPVGPPRQAGTQPFSELNVALYAAPRPDVAQVIVQTAAQLPSHGKTRTEPLPVGVSTWTLQASAVHPLVGTATADAPYLVLGSGLLLSLLVAAAIEAESRRRRSTQALYETEHHLAETLQRSLLPTLPTVGGLDLDARYLPGAAEQAVGGDWFDVFEIEDGRIGLVIGDVVGHDIAAAAQMSQIQASLRASAWTGDPPGEVLEQVDALIKMFDLSELVTVFYGLLDPPDANGARLLTYANAGHLPPILRDGEREIRELDDAGSLLLGAPGDGSGRRTQRTVILAPGTSLLMFTDGLVEEPGGSLTDALARLRTTLAAAPVDATASDLCDLSLQHIDPKRLRDDVAVLVVRMTALSDAGPTRGFDNDSRVGRSPAARALRGRSEGDGPMVAPRTTSDSGSPLAGA